MKCPVCGKEMVEKDFGVEVHVCENGCKGIWFDRGALAKLDEKNESEGQRRKRHPVSSEQRWAKGSNPLPNLFHPHALAQIQEGQGSQCG